MAIDPYRGPSYIDSPASQDDLLLALDRLDRLERKLEQLMSQTSGCNPSLYTNLKKKGAKKAPKK
jgi:hypothetical protein